MAARMKRVAGRKRVRPEPSGELPYMRHYAPNDGEVAPEAMTNLGDHLADRTGRMWVVARENDLYLRLYMLPIEWRRGD